MSLFYAYGPHLVRHGIPASAFSRGDLIMFDSSSSLSYANPVGPKAEWCGVALSGSTQSVSDEVPYLALLPGTAFWISTITDGSSFSEGFARDIDVASGDWEADSSVATETIRVLRNDTRADVQQRNTESGDSWVIVSFVTGMFYGAGAG